MPSALLGELAELRVDLQSEKKEKKKEAIKKIIASMTVGKDVSSLFPDVVNCMQTDNLELKKLVYLYLMNYAKSQPDLAILAVNTFSKVRCATVTKHIETTVSIAMRGKVENFCQEQIVCTRQDSMCLYLSAYF